MQVHRRSRAYRDRKIMILENVLKQRLKDAGMTQKQLAEKLKVSQQRISQFVCGTHAPSLTQAIIIADVLGIKVDDIWWVVFNTTKIKEPECK